MTSTEKTVKRLVSQFNFASWRAKEIAESLLTRAVDEGREEKMMERITFHFNRAHEMPEGHEQLLALAKEWEEQGMARAVRALNVQAIHEGAPVYFVDNSAFKGKGLNVPTPNTFQ